MSNGWMYLIMCNDRVVLMMYKSSNACRRVHMETRQSSGGLCQLSAYCLSAPRSFIAVYSAKKKKRKDLDILSIFFLCQWLYVLSIKDTGKDTTERRGFPLGSGELVWQDSPVHTANNSPLPATSPGALLRWFCSGMPSVKHIPVNSFPRCPRIWNVSKFQRAHFQQVPQHGITVTSLLSVRHSCASALRSESQPWRVSSQSSLRQPQGQQLLLTPQLLYSLESFLFLTSKSLIISIHYYS